MGEVASKLRSVLPSLPERSRNYASVLISSEKKGQVSTRRSHEQIWPRKRATRSLDEFLNFRCEHIFFIFQFNNLTTLLSRESGRRKTFVFSKSLRSKLIFRKTSLENKLERYLRHRTFTKILIRNNPWSRWDSNSH